jgi:isopenicillin-N N-acyltransferase like protein
VKKAFYIIFLLAEAFVGFLVVALILFSLLVKITPPEVADVEIPTVQKISDTHFTCGNNWLRQDDEGIWVVYIEGEPYERGLAYGALCEKLIRDQEVIFIGQIQEMIPSDFFLNFLKFFVAWFNKDMEEYVPLEYQQEIYGVSRSFSDDFDWVAPKYHRVINYHAAHDIGHALQELAVVGCTSFGASGSYSTDSTLIVGRNFDFYMGPEFAKQRLLSIVKPAEGYAYSSYSWAGLMGVVSGMNEVGLTVTINAAKSDLPTGAKDPISILAREVLQYASTIEEAVEICNKREVFVSESLMIGSTKDNRTAILEKSPMKFGVYDPHTELVVCSNHYQSDFYADDPANQANIVESDSPYRFELMKGLLEKKAPLDPQDAIAILSETLGQKDKDIGLGNQKSINQLIGHHAIIFKPAQQLFWISNYPNQIGGMQAFHLQELLAKKVDDDTSLDIDSLRLGARALFGSRRYADFQIYLEIKEKLGKAIYFGKEYELTQETEDAFLRSNAESYIPYMTLGQYYLKREDKVKAESYFEMALDREVSSPNERMKIKSFIHECQH